MERFKKVLNPLVILLVVTIYAPTKRRMDPPNFYPTVKALVDGMTDAGIWTDDNHEVIKYMVFKYGGLSGLKDKYRIEIEVKEIPEYLKGQKQ